MPSRQRRRRRRRRSFLLLPAAHSYIAVPLPPSPPAPFPFAAPPSQVASRCFTLSACSARRMRAKRKHENVAQPHAGSHTHTHTVNTCRSHMNLHTHTRTHKRWRVNYTAAGGRGRALSAACAAIIFGFLRCLPHTHTQNQLCVAKSAAKVIDGRNCFARYSNNNNNNKGPSQQPHTTLAMRVHKAKQIIANWHFRYSIWGFLFVCVSLLPPLFSQCIIMLARWHFI